MKNLAFVAILFLYSCMSTQSGLDVLIEKYGDSRHGWRHESGYMKENPVAADERSLVNGQKLYKANCSPCHGNKGRGDGILVPRLVTKPRDLTRFEGDRTDFHIYLQISLGDGVMPGRSELSEKDRWDIVNYVQMMIVKLDIDKPL